MEMDHERCLRKRTSGTRNDSVGVLSKNKGGEVENPAALIDFSV